MLPSGSDAYDHAYQNAMERIKGQVADQADLAKDVLSWITFAQRPLTTTEVQHALAVEVGETQLDEENIPQLEDMVSVCAGLVTVDEQSSIIRLVHYTTQEYFKRKGKHWFPSAETDIAKTCVTYLSFAAFGSGPCVSDDELEQRLRLNPLYDYAARNWGHHTRQASSLGREVTDFLQCQAKVEASIQALLFKKHWSRYSEVARPTTGLHLAAFLGVEEGIKALLGEGVDADSGGIYGRTPLSWAAGNGQEAILKLLLDTSKVDVDSKDMDGTTPLSWAAWYGHEAVAKLLLDTCKVDADSRDDRGQTPLSLAAEKGHNAVVKLLLDTNKVDADSRTTDYYGRTPLSLAAENGHNAVVKLLLDTNKVDVDSRDVQGDTPLSWAVMERHEAVVKLLLDTGMVDVDSRDTKYGLTPLSWAAQSGHEAIVKLLIDTGNVDADSRDNLKRTPLWYAAKHGHDTIVKILVSNKSVDPDRKDYQGSTPLSIATRNHQTEVAKYLLDTKRVDVNSQDSFGRTPLWYARKLGIIDIEHLLFDNSEKSGLSVCQNDLPTEERSRPFDESPAYCDICALSIQQGEEYQLCQTCNSGNFVVCLGCFEFGRRCLKVDHQLVQREC